jgi:hypothetical protein
MTFQKGMRIAHLEYGEGTVTLVDEGANQISLDFDRGLSCHRISLSKESAKLCLPEEAKLQETPLQRLQELKELPGEAFARTLPQKVNSSVAPSLPGRNDLREVVTRFLY